MEGFPQVTFLRNVITRPTIIVGDYTYYDDPEGEYRGLCAAWAKLMK